MSDLDKLFTGSISELYDKLLVPMIFESYAVDLSSRLQKRSIQNVLELAAGTGVVTRSLLEALPQNVSITATDLNQDMINKAIAIGTDRFVEWKQADAMQLPFPDGSFEAVVCQFGFMFFPEKSKAFAEVHRVLKPGGVLLFNVWDRIEENEFADTVTKTVGTIFPNDPPQFLARTPHGYNDIRIIKSDIAKGGFSSTPKIETVSMRSRASSCEIPALAYCQGTPLKNEIEARDPSLIRQATEMSSAAIGEKFGQINIDGKIQAHIIEVEKLK